MKNLLLSDTNRVFGLCVKRCNIRRVVGDVELFDKDGLDLNQESALLPFSLVTILNRWGNYVYIKSHSAVGWVDASSIAPVNRKLAKELFFSDCYCIVTDPKVSLCGVDYYMSCRIPLVDGLLQIPFLRNETLVFKTCPPKDGCHPGYLPFSRQNVLSQAVKFLGTPYDWGEKSGGVDCSSLIMYSFACCGITLPRSSGEQAKITFPVSAYPAEEIVCAQPGDIIFKPGHVMLSMGGRYIIHASFTEKKVCIGAL